MKLLKVLLSLGIVVAILFASALYVNAIGFTAEEVYESVFVVYSGDSLGSGFAIGNDCIVTNAHVISDRNSVVISTYGGKNYPAKVIAINEEQDIAILSAAGITFPFLTIADNTLMNTGDDVYAIGAPKSMAYTLTKGVISAKERKIGKYNYIQIDAAINEGNSGGPLLNDYGQVIGMNTLKMSDSEGIGLAIPMNSVCDYLKKLNIELDDAGNVAGNISENSSENIPEANNDEKQPEEVIDIENEDTDIYEDDSNLITVIAFGIAGISIVCNIILIVMLNYQKRRNLNLTYNPTERTDFEIDILE